MIPPRHRTPRRSRTPDWMWNAPPEAPVGTGLYGVDDTGQTWQYVPPVVVPLVPPATGGFLPLTGGQMLGPLLLAGDPVVPLGAATKAYVDAAVGIGGGPFLPLSGGTIDGATGLTVKNTGANANGVIVKPIGMYDTAPASSANPWTTFLAQTNVGTSGGHATDAVREAGTFLTSVYGAPQNFSAGLSAVASFNGTGGLGHETGAYLAAVRYNAVAQPTTTVAATLGAPNNVVQVADVTNLQVVTGDAVPITINGHGYMQVGVSGTSGAGTITLQTNATVADATSGNTVAGNNNPPMFGANVFYRDQTGLDSQHTNAALGMEIDLFCNGLDNGGTSGVRSVLTLMGVQTDTAGASTEIGSGISLGWAGNSVTFKRCINVWTGFNQSAFDTRQATQGPGAHTIWMADGQTIAFDTVGNVTLQAASGALQINPPVTATQPVKVQTGGEWSGSNFGKQLLITCPPGACQPAIAITDVNGENYWAIADWGGSFVVAAMPPYSDSTTAANNRLIITATGFGFNGTAAVAKPTVTGDKEGNVALASLMTALASMGLLTDSTT